MPWGLHMTVRTKFYFLQKLESEKLEAECILPGHHRLAV